MAGKKNNARREARMAKNNRNLNRALTIFTLGFVAEFYLLMVSNFYVKGTIDQLVAAATYLEVMAVVGAAVFGAGVVFAVMRKKWTRFAPFAKWLMGLGAFFAVSSYVMRKIYPAGTTAMCILVPVLMLLSVIFLLYQREFAVEAVALSLALASAVMLNHGAAASESLVRVLAALALLANMLLCFVISAAERSGGKVGSWELFPTRADLRVVYGVVVFSELMIALALMVSGGAFWAIWATAIALFALAVWHTVKML